MSNQFDFLKQISSLHEENPNYEIHFFVNNETISEEYNYTIQEIQSVETDVVHNFEGLLCVGEENIKEELENNFNFDDLDFDCTDEKLEEEINKIYNNLELQKAIIVKLSA